MPIQYLPDDAAHIAFVIGSGVVTYEDLVALIDQQRNDIGKRLHELNDYRGIEYSIDAQSLQNLAGLNRELYQGIENIRFAVVVDPGLGYGMSRMFEVYLNNSVEFKIFEEYDDAFKWVSEAAQAELD